MNERLADVTGSAPVADTMIVLCECALPHCLLQLDVPAWAYSARAAMARAF